MAAQKEVAVVAGVGPGLGAALCRTFAHAGYTVVGVARSIEFTRDLARELAESGASFVTVQCDIEDPSSVDSAFARIDREIGTISVYVHNASRLLIRPFLEMTAAEFEGIWRVTSLGAVLCTQKIIPHMLKRRRGTLIFTGATAALRGGARFSAFASAKFALRGLVQSLAREFGPQGIHVAHVVIDGIIWSDRAPAGVDERNCLKPDAIAETYLQLVRQKPSAWTQELDLRPDIEKF
ncbi:MAG: SDR family NAD(P)-dependent oxidoreductase [Acidiferrobacterales bacterium]